MAWRGILAVCLALAAPGVAAWGQDRLRPTAGPAVAGNLAEMTPVEVVIRKGPINKKTPVNEIEYIDFDGEPEKLTKARRSVHKGDFQAAAADLAKVKASEMTRPEVKADFEFYTALATARMALGGNGSTQDAGKQLLAFEKNNKSNYHYLASCEVLGDLLVSLGKFDQANVFYEKLSAAPWPDYKMRAGVLIARSFQAQKKFKEAIEKFDEVLALGREAVGKEAEREQLAATLGRATALAGSGKVDEAIKQVQQVIEATPKENLEAHARAYDALGTCYRLAGKKKEALLAFLHVHLLYSNFPEQHAESLANLAVLWPEVNKADRGAEARNLLKQTYPYSRWAQGAAQ